jgi:SH3-like domain-containing protein
MNRRLPVLLAFLLAAFLPARSTWALSPKPPGPIVTTSSANLRAKPSMSSEILVSLKKGQELLQVGTADDPKAPADEPKEWVEVAAPAGTKVWIFAALVDSNSKTVRAKKANLRAGPGRNYAEVGYLVEGAAIQELRAADGWLQIAAPEGAVVGYVAKSLIRSGPEGVVSKPEAKPVAPPPVTARTTPPARRPVPLPESVNREPTLAARSIPADPTVESRPLNSIPATRIQPAPTRVAQPIPEVVTPEPEVQSTPATPEPSGTIATTPPAEVTPTPAPPAVSVPSQPSIVHVDRPRQVMREGVIAVALTPQAPGNYQLDNFRKREGMIAFLYTDDPEIKLASWRWRRVLITGEEYVDARWPKSAVIKVTAIQPAY